MKGIIVLFLVSTLCISACAQIHISGDEDFQIVGGSSFTHNITLRNTAGKNIQIYFESSVNPDSNGINISYSENSPFTLYKGQTMNLSLYIRTSFYLAPLVYTVTTDFLIPGEPAPRRRTVHIQPVIPDIPIPTTPDEPEPIDIEPEPEPVVPAASDDFPLWPFVLFSLIIGILVTLFLILKKKKKEVQK